MPDVNMEQPRRQNGRFSSRKYSGLFQDMNTSESQSKVKVTGEIAAESASPLIKGRRIVDVSYVAEQLQAGCKHCGHALSLSDITGEDKKGLASLFQITCAKLECAKSNTIHSSKSHNFAASESRSYPVYDININTKAALGKFAMRNHIFCNM